MLGLRELPDALPGRMEIVGPRPVSQGEIHGTSDGFVNAALARGADLEPTSDLRRRDCLERLVVGGFPEAIRRTPRQRAAFFDTSVITLVERDVLHLAGIGRRADLLRLLPLPAGRSGKFLVPGAFGRNPRFGVGAASYIAIMTDAPTRTAGMANEALDLLIEAVERTPPESWDQPSNLEDWSLRELVGHATGSAAKIVTLVEGGEVWGRSEPADWVREEPASALREMAARLRVALPDADLDAPRASPQGEVPLRRALTYPVADLALHSWDLHRSQGRWVELPEDLLAFCGELVGSVPEDLLRRPGGFGPAQPAPEDATPTARLLAHLGRSV